MSANSSELLNRAGKGLFETTLWTVVLQAAGGAGERTSALEQLCQAYWYPIYAHVRRWGYSPEDAKDLTQSFFEMLLGKPPFHELSPDKGRFRSFLLAALRNFLGDARDRTLAEKRGGKSLIQSLDEIDFEGNYLAANDLIAMAHLAKVNQKDPTIAAQLIRAGVVAMGASILWDALQEPGWREPQLQAIQKAWQFDPLPPSMAASFHGTRLVGIEEYDAFRSGSYRKWESDWVQWISRPDRRATLVPEIIAHWSEYIFHPVWTFAWADLEKAAFLESTVFRTADFTAKLKAKAVANIQPAPSQTRLIPDFRFYFQPPLGEESVPQGSLSTPIRQSLGSYLAKSLSRRHFEIPHYAFLMKRSGYDENQRQMAVTAIALYRYKLQHGNYPRKLSSLEPDFLDELPIDWMDGHPLRYRLAGDGNYILYSIGPDGKDDGGDPAPESPGSQSAWNMPGKDLVWPQVVPWAD